MKKIFLGLYLVVIGWHSSVFAEAPGGPLCGVPGAPECQTATVPEPSILWLVVGGIASLGVVRYLKGKK